MTVQLPSPPIRIARLPKDDRGYPVPWFVAWTKEANGTLCEVMPECTGATPDFRILASGKRELAVKKRLCWICGEPLGVHQVFAIGPMCAVNRTTMEPPGHRACVEYAAKACPFLTRPRQKRNEKGLDEIPHVVSGKMITRNPGAIALWESAYRPFKVDNGWLIKLAEPYRVDWWAQGRPATRAEIEESIATGYPELLAMAKLEGPESIAELEAMRADAERFLPAAA
jgi:hypothetical protein